MVHLLRMSCNGVSTEAILPIYQQEAQLLLLAEGPRDVHVIVTFTYVVTEYV